MNRVNYRPTKVILIARVSDESQIDALPAQKLRLEKFAREKNFENYEYHEFNETAYSNNRKKFEEIISTIELESKIYHIILVFDKIDRFTRDSSSLQVNALKSIVKSGNLEIYFPSDNLHYHKNSPAPDKARLGMGMVFGEYYSAAISDNVKRKIEQKLNDGELPGKAPIGYINTEINGKKTVIPDPERFELVRKMFNLRLQNYSYRKIAEILRKDGLRGTTLNKNPIKASQVEITLKNPFYYGMILRSGKLYPHKYEPMIDKITFDKVQSVGKTNPNSKNRNITKSNFPYTGVFICGKCGCSMSPYYGKGNIYLHCSGAKGVCQNNISEKIIIESINKQFNNFFIPENQIIDICKELESKYDYEQKFYKDKRETLQRRYSTLERKQDILYNDRLEGSITIERYGKYNAEIEAELEEINNELRKILYDDKSLKIRPSYLLNLANNLSKLYESSQTEQKRQILKLLFANSEIKEKRLYFNLLEPFLTLSNCRKTQIWLRQLGSNQRPIG